MLIDKHSEEIKELNDKLETAENSEAGLRVYKEVYYSYKDFFTWLTGDSVDHTGIKIKPTLSYYVDDPIQNWQPYSGVILRLENQLAANGDDSMRPVRLGRQTAKLFVIRKDAAMEERVFSTVIANIDEHLELKLVLVVHENEICAGYIDQIKKFERGIDGASPQLDAAHSEAARSALQQTPEDAATSRVSETPEAASQAPVAGERD